MQTEKYRQHIRILFSIGLLFAVLVMVSFWNAFRNAVADKTVTVGIFPVLFGLTSIAAFIYMLVVALKATNQADINEYIEDTVSKEKEALLAELNKEKQEDEIVEEDFEVEELAKKLIPGRNFKKIDSFSKKILSNLANKFEFVQGIVYRKQHDSIKFSFVAGYGLTSENPIPDFELGSGLNGEVAQSKAIMVINEIPEDYFTVDSGLGSSQPGYLIIIPIIDGENTISIIEVTSFKPISHNIVKTLEKFSDIVSTNFNQLYKD